MTVPGSRCFGEEKLLETKGPVVITSSTLTADNKGHTALFEGAVVAKSETMTIFADKMLVYYTEDGKMTKIIASGSVKVIKGERVITSDEATYFAEEEKAVFTGQPKAVEGTSVVTGTKITYMMKDDRSIVENSKVFMERSSKSR
jgi:lipopolysaccharide export system protein LptA